MNQKENLILANNQESTADIRFCRYNAQTQKYDVIFQSGKKYEYGYNSIEWVRNPDKVDPALVHIAHGDRELFHIQSIFAFRARSGDYWHICFEDGSGRTYEKRSLRIEVSCLGEKKAWSRLDYLRKLAAINELKSDDGAVLLEKQYEKLIFVGQDTAMAVYLDPTGHCPNIRPKYTPIFPFGGNSSQFHAVSAALENQISVIQGPPGTGKTQTILNIIANLLATGKTVLVVSNNNSATENVLEKLSDPKNALGFLAAPLGKAENKTAFIQGQTGLYPKLSEWKQSSERQAELKSRIAALSAELSELFTKQERLAMAKQELNALTLEMKYFADYCKETGIDDAGVKLRRDLKSQRLMQLWQECCAFSDEDRSITLWFKLKSVLVYGISDWKFYQNNLPRIITMLQGLYYQTKKAELESEIAGIEKSLIENDAKNKMDELTKPTAHNPDSLKLLQTDVLTELVRSKLNVDRLLLRQREGFLAVGPAGYNIFGSQFERVLPASSAANLYPFNYSGKTDVHDFYLGRDKFGSNIIADFDQRDDDKTNANILILGNSGQGKSYLLKLILCNILESGKNVICLDPEHEYVDLAENLGGCFVDLMSGQYMINPLEPKTWDEGGGSGDGDAPQTFRQRTKLSQHISFLKDFFRCYKDFNDRHINVIEIMLSKLYEKWNISDHTDFTRLSAEQYPILSDLYALIEDEYQHYDREKHQLYPQELLQEILLGLHFMCQGAESKFFNGHTNVTSDRFIVFGVKGLLQASRNVKNALLFNVLSFMSDKLFTEGNTAASIDELYLFLTN